MPLMIDGKRYLFASELADQIGVCRQTMWRWRKTGAIPAGHKHRSGKIVFTEDEATETRRFANKVEPLGDPLSAYPTLF